MSLEADNATIEIHDEEISKDRLFIVVQSVAKMASVLSELQTQFQGIDKRLSTLESSDKVPSSTQEDEASRTREFLRAYKAVRSLNKLSDYLQTKRDQSSVSSGTSQREKLLHLLGVLVRTFDSSESISLNTRDDISALAIDEGFLFNRPECIRFESENGPLILSAGDLSTEQLRYLLAQKEGQAENCIISQSSVMSRIPLKRGFCRKTFLIVIIFTWASFSIGLCTIWKATEIKLARSLSEITIEEVTHSIDNTTLLSLTDVLNDAHKLSLNAEEFTKVINEFEEVDIDMEDMDKESIIRMGNSTFHSTLNSEFTKIFVDDFHRGDTFESDVNVTTQEGESQLVKVTQNSGNDNMLSKENSLNDTIQEAVDEKRVILGRKGISCDSQEELKFDKVMKEAELALRKEKKIRTMMFRQQIYTAIGMAVIMIIPQFVSFSLTGILGKWMSVFL